MAKNKKKDGELIVHKVSDFIIEYYSSIDKYLLKFYNKTDYWTNSFNVIREELEHDFIKYNRSSFIKIYFEGNLVRFLRKHRKQYSYQMTYSRTFKKWKKKKSTSRAMRTIIDFCENLPGECNNVANILITMNTYYDWDINKTNADIACKIYATFRNDIQQYNFKKNSLAIKSFKPSLNRKQALREQKARGFIKKKKFHNYNESFWHVRSIVDRRYIYPYNILPLHFNKQQLLEAQKEKDKNILFRTIYHGLSSIGVESYTGLEKNNI